MCLCPQLSTHSGRSPAALFFSGNKPGTAFEFREFDVTAGADVAFAYALLRCGTAADFVRQPEQRLRLTIGLRMIDGRWSVLHEHHSFSDASISEAATAHDGR